MDRNCIVSFGKGYNFEKGLERLGRNVENLLRIPFFGYSTYPAGCPTHQESPFAFKFFCIREVSKMAFDNILWLDSCIVIKNNLQDVFQLMSSNGYFCIKNWHSIGEYCHDKALHTLGITREQSLKLPCIQGTNFGLNFRYAKSRILLDEMIRLSLDGITFPGPYTNENHMASMDNRVAGHRHDQIAMSVVLLKMGMEKWFACGEHPWFIHDRAFVKGNINSTVTDIRMCNEH